MQGIFGLAEDLLASLEGLFFMELVTLFLYIALFTILVVCTLTGTD
jgi:hypothetical protein